MTKDEEVAFAAWCAGNVKDNGFGIAKVESHKLKALFLESFRWHVRAWQDGDALASERELRVKAEGEARHWENISDQWQAQRDSLAARLQESEGERKSLALRVAGLREQVRNSAMTMQAFLGASGTWFQRGGWPTLATFEIAAEPVRTEIRLCDSALSAVPPSVVEVEAMRALESTVRETGIFHSLNCKNMKLDNFETGNCDCLARKVYERLHALDSLRKTRGDKE